MYYLIILFGTLAICLGIYALFKYKYPKYSVKFIHIFTYVMIAVFFVRYFSYHCDIQKYIDYTHFENKPYDSATGIAACFFIWMGMLQCFLLMFRNFYDFKTIRIMSKFITPFTFIGTVVLFKPIIGLLSGSEAISTFYVAYAVELGMTGFLIIKNWWEEPTFKYSWKNYLLAFVCFLLLCIPTMPEYYLQFNFGFYKKACHVIDFTKEHRYFLYASFIAPLCIYLGLRKRSYDIRRFSLSFIAVAIWANYCTAMHWTIIFHPSSWPLHLCNTALFILPISILFKAKRLFYFTIFLNVAGAAIANFVPNYDFNTNLFSRSLVHYWQGHFTAFFLPILYIALKIFDRPKSKQFLYSTIFFTMYYLFILFFNAYFTAKEGAVHDWFFINSTFIAKKLGKWAEDLFINNATLTLPSGLKLVFHPLYQSIYYVVYIIISLGCWFLYQLGFDLEDRLIELNGKLKKIKVDRLALESMLDGRSIEEPMNENAGIKLELKNFSKRYGNSDHYAVKDASLEVYGGEIFGFLGPNGAGKSTIIKSIVGIQPITSGNIEICGFDAKKQSIQAKRQLGFVPDHYALYEKLTGREYISYIADIYHVSQEDRDERMNKYIKLFEMEQAIDNKIKTYSHGMKQKITIMSALVHEPKVWILDEPLTGLDPNSIYQVKECMKEHARKGNIVFFSSHIIDIVEKLCERIAIIKHGQIQCIKTVSEIEQSGTSLEQFYLDTIGDNADDNLNERLVETEEIVTAPIEEKKPNFFKRLFTKKDKKTLEDSLEITEERLEEDCDKDTDDNK